MSNEEIINHYTPTTNSDINSEPIPEPIPEEELNFEE